LDYENVSGLEDWRKINNDQVIRVGTILITFPLIKLIYDFYIGKSTWHGPLFFTVLFILLLTVSLNNKMDHVKKGWFIVIICMMAESVDLIQGGLVGDGRMWLVALPVIAFVIIDIHAGWVVSLINMLIFIGFGFLHSFGIFDQYFIYEGNIQPTEFWISSGFFQFAIMGMVIVLISRIHLFMTKVISEEMETAKKLNELNGKLENLVSGRTKELSKANKKLEYFNKHDFLTGIPNRKLFFEYLEELIDNNETTEQIFACLFIDIDNFKSINDTYGHSEGDKLLKWIGQIFQNFTRDTDIVARVGGDEFVMIFRDVTKREIIVNQIARIMDKLKGSYKINGGEIEILTSIGISEYPKDSKDIDEIVNFADEAMYVSKRNKKGTYSFYSEIHAK
jgi:diguanylate cyclase (GGDEF)-like protein